MAAAVAGSVPVTHPGPDGVAVLYLGGEEIRGRAYAEATQRVIDEEVAALLREAEQRALDLLSSHHHALQRLIDELLLHETIDGDAVRAAITGPARASCVEPRLSVAPNRNGRSAQDAGAEVGEGR